MSVDLDAPPRYEPPAKAAPRSQRSRTQRPPHPQLPRLLWAVAGLSVAATAFRSRHFVYDDAYISFRYARNLTDHGELVWNLGERVEGYTNFLHVMTTSALMAVGIDPIVGARLLNLLMAVALVALYRQSAHQVARGPESSAARAVGGLFLITSVCLPLWLLGALEAVMVAAFELAAIHLLLPLFFGRILRPQRVVGAGVLLALATLTRPDAVVIAGAMLLGGLLFAPINLRRRLRCVMAVGVVMSVIVGAHVLWRWSYYGELVPNTFNAKVGVPLSGRLSFGLEYVGGAMVLVPLVPVALALFLWNWGTTTKKRPVSPVVRMLTMCVVLHVAYVVWAGGDHLPAARFFVPLLGPAALLVAAAIARRPRTLRPAMIVGLTAAIITPLALAIPFHGGAEAGEVVGRYIAEEWPEDSLVALNVAGATPYYAPDLRFIDMLGLNDAVIARRDPVPMRTEWQERPGHAKGDGAYVLSREPDFVILAGAFGSDADDGLFLGDIELAESDEFVRCYERRTETIAPVDDYRSGPLIWDDAEFIYYARVC